MLPDNSTNPIIGIDISGDLESASLLHGIRYFLHLQITMLKEWVQLPQPIRRCYSKAFAKFAFGLAMCSAPANDPTLFLNDTDKKGLIQQLLDKCKLTKEDIPLSCLQLAMYSPMIVDSNRAYSEIDIKHVNLKSAGDLDKWCGHKIREQRLHKLIPLICEIGLLNLTKDTVKLMESGDTSSWRKIDHLQFLIAVLRGHWGMNSFAVIKKLATFHLMEAMKELQLWLILKKKPNYAEYENLLVYSTKVSWNYDYNWHIDNLKIQLFRKEAVKLDHHQVRVKDHIEHYIHRYKLCCMCYTLMCGDHFVRFVEPDEQYHQFGILACTKGSKLCSLIFKPHQSMLSATDELFDVTPDGFVGTSLRRLLKSDSNEVLSQVHTISNDKTLPWDKQYQWSISISDSVHGCTTSQRIQSHMYNDEIVKLHDYKNMKLAVPTRLMRAPSDVTAPKSTSDLANNYSEREENLRAINMLNIPVQDYQNKLWSVFEKFQNPTNNDVVELLHHNGNNSSTLRYLFTLFCSTCYTRQSKCDSQCIKNITRKTNVRIQDLLADYGQLKFIRLHTALMELQVYS